MTAGLPDRLDADAPIFVISVAAQLAVEQPHHALDDRHASRLTGRVSGVVGSSAVCGGAAAVAARLTVEHPRLLDDRHVRPFAGVKRRDRATDAAVAPGDDGDLALEPA